MKLIYVIFVLTFTYSLKAQVKINDSIPTQTITPIKHSAKKATVLSIVLPGAGQVYNKKIWKVPIIYAGLGGFGYMFYINQNQYSIYRKNLIAENDKDSTTVNSSGFSSSQLQSQKLYYRKFRDLSAFGVILMYALNVIDANVDGHLKTFDVSDDLSLELKAKPIFIGSQTGIGCGAGISLKLNIK